jgi:hypothetical protein
MSFFNILKHNGLMNLKVMSVFRTTECRVLWCPANNELKMTWNYGSNMQVHDKTQSETNSLLTSVKTKEFRISI